MPFLFLAQRCFQILRCHSRLILVGIVSRLFWVQIPLSGCEAPAAAPDAALFLGPAQHPGPRVACEKLGHRSFT